MFVGIAYSAIFNGFNGILSFYKAKSTDPQFKPNFLYWMQGLNKITIIQSRKGLELPRKWSNYLGYL